MSAADVSSLPLSEWPAAVTLRDAGPSRGRGIFAQRSIAAGEAILCEEAVAAAPLPTDAADPWQAAAPLVAALLERSAVHHTHALEPQQAVDASVVPAAALAAVRRQLAPSSRGSTAAADDAAVARLLLVVARNAHAARADGVTHQGIFPHVAMINHSCLPNATHQGFARTGGEAGGGGGAVVCLCVRAVCEIVAGSEISISYVEDLTAGVAVRSARAKTLD